jgi:hypothetical protein
MSEGWGRFVEGDSESNLDVPSSHDDFFDDEAE